MRMLSFIIQEYHEEEFIDKMIAQLNDLAAEGEEIELCFITASPAEERAYVRKKADFPLKSWEMCGHAVQLATQVRLLRRLVQRLCSSLTAISASRLLRLKERKRRCESIRMRCSASPFGSQIFHHASEKEASVMA